MAAYFMRYVLRDPRGLDLRTLERGLQARDPHYAIVRDAEDLERGRLFHDDEPCARLELDRPDDPAFAEDLAELTAHLAGLDPADLEEHRPQARRAVLDLLRGATHVLVLKVLWRDRDTEDVLALLDPVWDWLYEHRRGLMRADAEGFFDADGPVLTWA